MSAKRTGRRTGSPDTRSEILDAAKRVFGKVGYDRATIREIANEADVDPSLIYHYFGTKDQLFATSIEIPIPAVEKLQSVFAADREDLGRRLAETFFFVWEQEAARVSLLGILRSAMGGEHQAADAFRQFLTTSVLDQISPLIGGENPRLRALLMASQLVGVAMTRYVMRLEPIASAPIEDIVELVAPRIQSYAAGE
ncbi:MAG TPA: TetR family transcriptional regulator [Acidimicrobiia bacterium]|nr:TetR family transcriptional regulator [Acidimicrobiia bacterium]